MSTRTAQGAGLEHRSVDPDSPERAGPPSRIRVRLHGRGGQGVKTAGRILGTGAFLSGSHCQDFPVYGAERRGAPVAAFARIGSQPIDERGVISEPDLIIVADATLLDDPATGVLDGQQCASAVFLNAAPDAPLPRAEIIPPLIRWDLTGAAIERLGRAGALSAGLGAAAARLVGLVTEDRLVEAIRSEFSHLGLSPGEVEANVAFGLDVFHALPVVSFRSATETEERPGDSVIPILAADPLTGGPNVISPGNAILRNTGAWRLERPVIDRDRCTRCGLCLIRCPDGAISWDEEGLPVIDEQHCKGCLICRQICPIHGIGLEEEART
ncbi:2-oxoacid:acceptor oxidoreductase family protein [Tautonia marina]|uniref:2-oxoacid:acceptor oxidoreductase family protein n=1 Tax=Tautonia marina TaxID=2653855 RepID=UPI00126064FC|nr:2-oxoacid:acceptor oxidoreductase family protein [Tautonia marina]